MKLQHLDLGKGTSQHVLISGKTGSGKSTLLHVLITNLALRYSPDEVELYLVDFKKGVEFKAYARHELPHARVIAIESEREFGLSVLQRLDAELRIRGDLFRKLGVQDLKGFRGARSPTSRLPRILLVIDEFQELFVEDDRIAQEASLLLGPAGAARPGVRHPRPPGLADAGRGVFDRPQHHRPDGRADRPAVQRGRRPPDPQRGEHGRPAAHPPRRGDLQRRQRPATRATIRSRSSGCPTTSATSTSIGVWTAWPPGGTTAGRPPIVFEGNVPADPAENRALAELLAGRRLAGRRAQSPQVWLGSAVAIKDPTGRHVRPPVRAATCCLVGHREEASLGVLATCLLSLAAQLPPAGTGVLPVLASGTGETPVAPGEIPPARGETPAAPSAAERAAGARFYILDGTRPDAPEAGYLARLVAAVPHAVSVVEPRQADAADRRIGPRIGAPPAGGAYRRPAADLPVHLQFGPIPRPAQGGRVRLRRAGRGEAGQPRQAVRLDPPRGTGLWHPHPRLVRSLSTVNRLLDRQSLRDFDMRVLFQMNATDSSSLMDSPDAGAAGRASGDLLRRGPRPRREVPALRPAFGRVAGPRRPTAPQPRPLSRLKRRPSPCRRKELRGQRLRRLHSVGLAAIPG